MMIKVTLSFAALWTSALCLDATRTHIVSFLGEEEWLSSKIDAKEQNRLLYESGSKCIIEGAYSCTKRCYKSKAPRRKSSCKLGADFPVESVELCISHCTGDQKCALSEVYRANGQLQCSKFACTEPDRLQFRWIKGIQSFSSFVIQCPLGRDRYIPAPTSSPTNTPTLNPTRAPTKSPQCSNPYRTSQSSAEEEQTTANMGRVIPAKFVRPNIIFVFVDDFGIGDVNVHQLGSFKRNNPIETPFIQKMADHGITFTQAYSSDSVCLPSRNALLVGKQTGQTGPRGNSGVGVDIPLSTKETTFAEVLSDAGYITGLIGKWGLGGYKENAHPNQRGFDYFYGHLSHTDAHSCFPNWISEHRKGSGKYDNNIEIVENGFASKARCAIDSLDKKGQCRFSHDLFTEKALGFITDNAKAGKKFFLQLSYTAPHVCSWSKNVKDPQVKVAPYMDPNCEKTYVTPRTGPSSLPSEECRHKSLIENYIDRDVGKILSLIKSLGVYDDTLVIFAGDNGPENVRLRPKQKAEVVHSVDAFGSTLGLRGLKREVYEGSLRTPLIMQWPRYISKGMVSDLPTVLSDLFRTFAEIAEVREDQIPSSINSLSLLPTLFGKSEKQQKHELLYWEYCEQQVLNWRGIKRAPENYCSWAIRIHEFKLVYNADTKQTELFNLSLDPKEKVNLISRARKNGEAIGQESFMTCLRENKAYVPIPSIWSPP